MCIRYFCVDFNPPFNTVKRMVLKLLMLHENIDLLPSIDFYDLSTGNDELIEGINIFLVGTPTRNKLFLIELAKDY